MTLPCKECIILPMCCSNINKILKCELFQKFINDKLFKKLTNMVKKDYTQIGSHCFVIDYTYNNKILYISIFANQHKITIHDLKFIEKV